MSESERRNWPRKLREIAEAHGIDAAKMEECIKALPESDWAWRVPSLTSPYTSGFADVISALIRRRLAGNPVLTKSDGNHKYSRRGPPPGNGRRRPGANRRRGRGEYPSYTTSQRDVLWAQHKDRYLELVDQGLDPNLHGDAIAKALGVTREEGHILHAAYCAWLSVQERPMDLSFLDEDT